MILYQITAWQDGFPNFKGCYQIEETAIVVAEAVAREGAMIESWRKPEESTWTLTYTEVVVQSFEANSYPCEFTDVWKWDQTRRGRKVEPATPTMDGMIRYEDVANGVGFLAHPNIEQDLRDMPAPPLGQDGAWVREPGQQAPMPGMPMLRAAQEAANRNVQRDAARQQNMNLFNQVFANERRNAQLIANQAVDVFPAGHPELQQILDRADEAVARNNQLDF